MTMTQPPERFILDGETWSMNQRPHFPRAHRHIRRTPPPADLSSEAGRQWTWHQSPERPLGYVGTWTVDKGRLYLVHLSGVWQVRPGQRVFARWFSGELLVFKGAPLPHVRRMHDLIHEHEVVIQVMRGRVQAMFANDDIGKKRGEVYLTPSERRHRQRQTERLRRFVDQLDEPQ
ncbi:MAG: hypothetical protein LC129_06170 [Burkholderiales bacterium]|nr:hypothetical protein [Burkholderiales bacterium]